jgi:4-amino-4-deoxy-L-arabinose transferase-like glycosyltransferase
VRPEQADSTPRQTSRLILLLVGALLMRAGWGLSRPVDDRAINLLPDQREYLELGRNLLRSHELKFHDQRFDADVHAYRVPGYPALIAACGGNVRVVRLVQAVLDTSSVLAAYLLARRWLSRRASLLATALVAINPFLIYFSGLILSETLFVMLLAWTLVLLMHRQLLVQVLGLMIAAASVLVRPSAIALPTILAAACPLMSRRSGVTILLSIGGAILTLLTLLPWAMRNQAVLSERVWTTTNSGITAYDGFNPAADGSSNQNFVRSMPQLKSMSEVDRSHYLSSQAQQYAAGNPFRVIQLAVIKIARTFSPIPLSAEFGRQKLYVAGAALYSLPFDLLVLAGLLRGSISRRGKFFLMIPALYFAVVHAMSVGSLRYRMPAEVPMAVIAASVIAMGLSREHNALSAPPGAPLPTPPGS